MAKITYPDKSKGDQFFGTEATEIKDSVNALYSDGNTWYVSDNKGDDDNIGSTKAEPFEGVAAAALVAQDGDTIEILNKDYTKDEAVEITTNILIKGPSSYQIDSVTAILRNFWTIDSGSVYFQNVDFQGKLVRNLATEYLVELSNSRFRPTQLPGTLTRVTAISSNILLTANRSIKRLQATHSVITGDFDLTIDEWIRGHHIECEGNIIAGFDTSSDCILNNSSVTGTLTITGTLESENSKVKGALSVSGAVTGYPKILETIKLPLGAADTAQTVRTVESGIHIDYDFTFIGLPTLEFNPIITDGGPTGQAFIVDINVADIDGSNKATILSTKLSVDAGEYHSSMAATPAVLSSNTIAKYKFISIDIDQIGNTLAGKGGFVTLNGYRT